MGCLCAGKKGETVVHSMFFQKNRKPECLHDSMKQEKSSLNLWHLSG
jgi:hypothetical protein